MHLIRLLQKLFIAGIYMYVRMLNCIWKAMMRSGFYCLIQDCLLKMSIQKDIQVYEIYLLLKCKI